MDKLKKNLTEEYYYEPNARYALSSSEIWDGFIQPWLDVLKIAKLLAESPGGPC